MSGPVQVKARVLANEPAGAYRRIVLAAPGVAETARPGQFVALAVGDEPTAMLLRRSFSLHRADPGGASAQGPDGPTIELVVADAGPGSRWVTLRRPGDVVDVLGPLGRPFPAPSAAGTRCVLVGGGYGSAPLLWWAQELRDAGHEVHLVLGAGDAQRLFGVAEAEALGSVVGSAGGSAGGGVAVHVTTDDGSAGTPGRVTAVLPDLLRPAADAACEVYACGPMAMLRAVHEVATAAGASSWLAVEESMACGIGVCMTCVLPIRHEDGVTRMTRSCVDGPTFAGDAVRWDAVDLGPHGATSRVPVDCLGAPALTPGAH